jgi:1-acyl-sn-glycerol-3-phosphate acyltransferase
MSAPSVAPVAIEGLQGKYTAFERLRLLALVVATFGVLTIGAVGMLVVAVPTLGLARRLYSEVIARGIGACVLWLWGVRFVRRYVAQPPAGQVVYISNHSSTLDVFVLIALALPRTRFFLSGFLKKVLPLGIIGYLIRIFWTVQQHRPDERQRIFARADRILRATGDSVYLSPEGQRVTTGGIGHFNKGAFHLATSLQAPLVPLYFAIPRAMNPGRGYDAKPGTMEVWFLPAIDTSAWRLENLEQNRDAVHALFVQVHESMQRSGTLPPGMAP